MKKITVLTSLYKCQKYLQGYFDWVHQIDNPEEVEILLLHNAPSQVELDIIQQNILELPFVRHIIISELEGLYATWNRGIRMAEGQYVCVWNVDDIRFPESLSLQAATLDENPDILLTYCDFHHMYQYGCISDEKVINEDFLFSSSVFFVSHQIGCFPMWRKVLHEKFGYFDEQFFLVADFDFQIRLARTGKVRKTEGALGAYLEDAPEKLSSNQKRQTIERNIVYLRYAVWEYLNWFTLFSINKEHAFQIKNGNEWISVSSVFDSYWEYRKKRYPKLFNSIWKQPRGLAAFIKHCLLNK